MIMKVEPPSIRPKLAMLARLIVAASLVLAAAHPAAALDAVSLQLKWKHQFQFAGYYQALEQGFYRDAGLDVTIREGGPGIDAAEAVAGGKADFGVCTASVLRDWAAGRGLVVWPPYSNVPRPSSSSRVGQTSAAWRICAAVRSWIRLEATRSPRC
jgi:ABC-type nitrate/sulfonate/bicarbonate transport system substrate-binding protein